MRDKKPIVQLSKTFPEITIEDSYAIQSVVNEAKVAAGAKVRGHKVGLTSKAMQQSSQIDEPDYGVLMDDMFYDDGATEARRLLRAARRDGARVRPRQAAQGPGVGLLDVLSATE